MTKDQSSERSLKRSADTFGLIAPSVVPLFNPALRVLEYDLSDNTLGQIMNYWQYYVDLDEANSNYPDEPKLKLEYIAKDVYGPGPFTAKYYRKLQNRMSIETSLKEKYELFRVVSCRSCLALPSIISDVCPIS
jgi:hypothetical protein